MKAGDTFQLRDRWIEGEHPHFVVCHPSQEDIIVIANLTEWHPDKDASCILEAGQDQVVKKRSIVSYRDAKLVSNSELDDFLTSGAIALGPRLSQATLDQILRGFSVTRKAKVKVVAFLDNLGLIPLV